MTTGSESSQEAFDRGRREGGVEARLVEHENHLRAINGSIDRGVGGLAEVKLSLQKLASDMQASLDTVIATARAAADTVVATAEALRQQESTRRTADRDARAKSEASWSPWQKFLAVITTLAVAAGTAVGVYASLHR